MPNNKKVSFSIFHESALSQNISVVDTKTEIWISPTLALKIRKVWLKAIRSPKIIRVLNICLPKGMAP